MQCCNVMTKDIGGGPSIAFRVVTVPSATLGRVQANAVDICRSRQWLSALHTKKPVAMIRTFAMRALRSERTRNLNLSSSVCTMTSLKFAEGSAVAFMSSMASILGVTVSTNCQTQRKMYSSMHTCLATLCIVLSTRSAG